MAFLCIVLIFVFYYKVYLRKINFYVFLNKNQTLLFDLKHKITVYSAQCSIK